MAVTFPLVNLLMAFCLLVAVGCAALCSIELGRKDMEKARSMLGHSVLLEIIFGCSSASCSGFFSIRCSCSSEPAAKRCATRTSS